MVTLGVCLINVSECRCFRCSLQVFIQISVKTLFVSANMGKGNSEGCAACSKIFLIIFNVLFCIIGAGLIATGVYAYITLSDYLNVLGGDSRINGPAIALLAFGVITFVIAAIGCIGACKEKPCLLFTFSVIIGLLLLAEIVIGIVGFVYRSEIKDFLTSSQTVGDLLKTYDSPAGKDSWDNVQKTAECCGINGPTDWTTAGRSIPASCGGLEAATRPGCLQKGIELAEQNIYYIGAVGIALGVIQLLGVVLACCVGCQARKGAYA